MRGEQDFAAYVAARGGTAVRCLQSLGTSYADAEETTAETFATLRPDWRELSEAGDLDVTLYATLLAADARRRRRSGGEAATPHLAAAVLRHEVGLEEVQVCEVLGLSLPELREMLAAQRDDRVDPGSDSTEQPVLPVSYDRVRVVVARRRRRRLLVSGAAAVALAGVLAVVALARPGAPPQPGDALSSVRSTEKENPAGVGWWADGVLHLADSAVEIGEARRLVAVGDGAAYVDGAGDLIHVDADGRRTFLGRPAERTAVVSEPGLGLVGWVDAMVPDNPRLVVWDTTDHEQVAAVAVSSRSRAITFVGNWLTFGSGLTDWTWNPRGGPARETGNGYAHGPRRRSALVDVVGGTRLEQVGYNLMVVRTGERNVTRVPGFGGTLSADGKLVLTGRIRQPRLFEARTGERVDSWFPPTWDVRDATFVSRDRVAWLVDRGRGNLVLITCGSNRDGAPCSDAVDLGTAGDVLLADDSD